MTSNSVYQASRIKRHRASREEMRARAEFLVSYAKEHGPITVRGLFYQATVAELPGIDKTENGYNKIQAQVLQLRRDGVLPYNCISDATRYMRKPSTHDGYEEAFRDAAYLYRKNLWARSDQQVEIWIEKSALAGVLYPVTSEYDVPLMPTGGFTSETFAYGAVSAIAGADKDLVIYSLYDFDRSGKDAERSLCEKVNRFGREYGVHVNFNSLGLDVLQVAELNLPTRAAKRGTVADKRWPYEFAAELDAIPPGVLRSMVQEAIELHLPHDELRRLKVIEEAERETALSLIDGWS